MSRPFDLVVFGATGFTGRLVCLYLADRLRGTDVSWAVAGRSQAKLDGVRSEVLGIDPDAKVSIVQASSDDRASLDAMAAGTRVVLTTVGPYARHGFALAEACVEAGTDCVDITGEPEFVNALLEKLHARAEQKGVRIVDCCGFDSVPHDLGALFTVQKLPGNEPVSITAMVEASGGISGGTWHSAVNAMSRPRASMKQLPTPALAGRRVGSLGMSVRRDPAGGAWLVPLPTIDPAIVMRSARELDVYGPDFRYGHYARVTSTVLLAAGAVGIGAVALLAQLPPTRALLLKWKSPGEGPSEEVRRNGWFRVTFVAQTPSRTLRTRVSGGEPGYTETAKMVAESALCLVLDRDRLPAHAGVLTPAVAFGDRLIERLIERGFRFEVLPD